MPASRPQQTLILNSDTLPPQLLQAFYRRMYPDMPENHFARLSWLYNGVPPVVAMDQDCVVAHAARIPFGLRLGGTVHRTSWYVDFAVLPEYQGQGLGKRLTQVWMAYAPIAVSFCNEKSMGIFRQFGWIESFRPQLHFLALTPFDHRRFKNIFPDFLRRTLNFFPKVFYPHRYHRHLKSKGAAPKAITLQHLDRQSIDQFQNCYRAPSESILPQRDAAYFSWRLLQSPDRQQYRIAHLPERPEIQAILKLNVATPASYIDVLCLSKPTEVLANTDLLAHVALWAGQNAMAYVRILTCDPTFSKLLKKHLYSFSRPHRFTYFAADAKTKEMFESARWDFELIDSDWEQFA